MIERRTRTPAGAFVVSPFVVIIDTREQAPYHFKNLECDSSKSYKPLIVRTSHEALATGDYSIKGMSDSIAIERKSLEDAYGTFLGFKGDRRARFERELERMSEMKFAAVVIEADWPIIMGKPPEHFKGKGKIFYRTVLAWQQRYGVHFWTCRTRGFAEKTTFRMLERFWNDTKHCLSREE